MTAHALPARGLRPATSVSSIADQGARALHLADMLRALAHPIRLRVIACLIEGDANVTELTARLRAGQPAVSQQLRILRMCGLVKVERGGGFARYALAEPGLRRLLACLEGCKA